MGEFNIYCIFSSVILIFFKTYYIRKSVYNFCIARCNILYSAMQNFVSGNAKYDKRLFLLKKSDNRKVQNDFDRKEKSGYG